MNKIVCFLGAVLINGVSSFAMLPAGSVDPVKAQTIEIFANEKLITSTATFDITQSGPLNVPKSNIYSDAFQLPRAPVVHPYNPIFCVVGGLYSVIGLRFPQECSMFFSPEVRAAVAGSTPEIFFVIEPNHAYWKDEERLFRPHYFLDQVSPAIAAAPINNVYDIQVGLFNVSAGVKLREQAVPNTLVTSSVSTHSGDALHTVVSPCNLQIDGLLDRSKTHSFFSVVREPKTNRSAVTLHWILDDVATESLRRVIITKPDLTMHSLITEVDVITPKFSEHSAKALSLLN